MSALEQQLAELRKAHADALYKLGYICALIGVCAERPTEEIAARIKADRAELAQARQHLSGRELNFPGNDAREENKTNP
jgi:hypothetical protein